MHTHSEFLNTLFPISETLSLGKQECFAENNWTELHKNTNTRDTTT